MLERQAADYIPGPVWTKFFSSSDPRELFLALAAFARGIGNSEYNEELYKMKVQGTNDEYKGLVYKAEVTKVKEGLHAVEFIRRDGDKFAFSKAFKAAKTFFGGHVNANLN